MQFIFVKCFFEYLGKYLLHVSNKKCFLDGRHKKRKEGTNYSTLFFFNILM